MGARSRGTAPRPLLLICHSERSGFSRAVEEPLPNCTLACHRLRAHFVNFVLKLLVFLPSRRLHLPLLAAGYCSSPLPNLPNLLANIGLHLSHLLASVRCIVLRHMAKTVFLSEEASRMTPGV